MEAIMEFKFDPIEEIIGGNQTGHIVNMHINRMASARGLICMPMVGKLPMRCILLRWFVIIRTATRRHFLRQLILRDAGTGISAAAVP